MDVLDDIEFDYSAFLFCPDGSPLNFYVPPHRLKSRFRTLIEKGGGKVSNKDTPDCLRLLMPGIECKIGEMIACDFVVDSIHNKCLQNKDKYIVPKGSSFQKNDDAEDSSPNHRTTKSLPKGRTPFTTEEDETILKYLLQNKRYLSCLGQQMWVKAEKEKVTNHTWQSMKARFRLIATRLNQYIHLDPAIKDLMNFLQSRSKAKVWEKSPDKIMKKNIDLFRDLESTSSEEEGVSCPQPKKLKAGEGPNRDCAGSPRLDPPSGAQDTGKDGKTVASTTNRLQNCRESSSETISNPETVQEALEHDRQPESQGSNASIDSILFDLRSKSVNLKEFLKRHKDPKFGGKNPDILKCVAVERKYEPCKCHPTRIDRRDRMAELMPPALGEPSPEQQVLPTTTADFVVDKATAELIQKRLDIPKWVLDSALFFNNCNLEDAIHWLLNNKATKSGRPSYNHKDDNLILRGSPDDFNELESKFGMEGLEKRRKFLQYLAEQKQ